LNGADRHQGNSCEDKTDDSSANPAHSGLLTPDVGSTEVSFHVEQSELNESE
jgi:hypothetical protein